MPSRPPNRPRRPPPGSLDSPAGRGAAGLLAAWTLLVALPGCGGKPQLAFVPVPIRIGYDAAEVFDAVAVDGDGDGDLDIVAATADGLRYLRNEGGAWSDATAGTALDGVPPVDRVELDGRDLLVSSQGEAFRLAFTGVGSWHAGGAQPPAQLPPLATSVDVELSDDGAIDRASIVGVTVHVQLRDRAGALHDVSTQVASDALPLRAPGRRLIAADLDGDGDFDLLAVGGRLLVLLCNGGELEAAAATDP
jgi:hypothetical protein